jgi:protein-S-isoprenylcysteine O-methyltransferase Ste14
MIELAFKIIFVVLWVFYILIRAPYNKMYKQDEKRKHAVSTEERFLLFLLSIGILFIPLIWLLTSWLDRFDLNFPLWLRLLGVVIAVLSLFYFWWIHKTLGANWSPTVEFKQGQELIKTGPYKSVRHPMYGQFWLWTIAQLLILSNSVAGFSGVVACALLYFIRVPKEEKMMIENFGDKYVEYMKETGKVLPKMFSSKK